MQSYEIEEITKSDIPEDLLVKVIVVGDCAVGKSNILSRYMTNEFSAESRTTIGVELATKVFRIGKQVVKLNVWDTAGQERFTALTGAYYKGARGAFIVYDITRKETFDNVRKWYRELRMKVNRDIYVVLIGNKSDLYLLRKVTKEQGEDVAKEMKGRFYETSALDARNVDVAFKEMVVNVYHKLIHENEEEDDGKFSLNSKLYNDEHDIGLRCNC